MPHHSRQRILLNRTRHRRRIRSKHHQIRLLPDLQTPDFLLPPDRLRPTNRRQIERARRARLDAARELAGIEHALVPMRARHRESDVHRVQHRRAVGRVAVDAQRAVDVGAEADDLAVRHLRFGRGRGGNAGSRGLEEGEVGIAAAGGVAEEDVRAQERVLVQRFWRRVAMRACGGQQGEVQSGKVRKSRPYRERCS